MCYVYVHYVTQTLCQLGSSKAVAEQKISRQKEVRFFKVLKRTQIVKVRERDRMQKKG